MPNFDRTGPRGMGPMTGRGMGYCGRGRGFGRGYGRGYGYREPIVFNKEEERKILEAEKAEIEKRLKELED